MRILVVKPMMGNEFWQKPEWVEINSIEEIKDYEAKGYEIIKVEGEEESKSYPDDVECFLDEAIYDGEKDDK